MRISWLPPDTVRRAQTALAAHGRGWDAFFHPEFAPPVAPAWTSQGAWLRIAEHVARAERVSQVVREGGLDAAVAAFGGSRHAIELATVVAAAACVERVSLDLLEALLACEIDDLVVYGEFLAFLHRAAGDDPARAVAIYERFCAAFCAASSAQPQWAERVAAVRDGLAALYVRCGRHDDGHALFAERHEQQAGDLVVALAASRSFLSAGAVSRAAHWLGIAAERAHGLGRAQMAERLRDKQRAISRRLR